MQKRVKFLISTILSTAAFFLFLYLPFENRYYALVAGTMLVTFCYWFGLGVVFDSNLLNKIALAIVPGGMFLGMGLFAVLFPNNLVVSIIFSLIFGLIIYILFLVENVFMVAIGFRTVPLYRAAYTVSFIVTLLTSFFLFNTLLSYQMASWINFLIGWVIAAIIFLYQFWAIAIELPDDGKTKRMWLYVLVPSLVVAQLTLVFSFWPAGIFKSSIYLVSAVYIISSLLQMEIKEKLFTKNWMQMVWIGIAIILGILFITRWG